MDSMSAEGAAFNSRGRKAVEPGLKMDRGPQGRHSMLRDGLTAAPSALQILVSTDHGLTAVAIL
jgi:hypothetical protein